MQPPLKKNLVPFWDEIVCGCGWDWEFGDLSPRAVKVLMEASLVLCEDKRRTGMFLSGLGIKKKLMSYFDHNEQGRVDQAIALLKSGDVSIRYRNHAHLRSQLQNYQSLS